MKFESYEISKSFEKEEVFHFCNSPFFNLATRFDSEGIQYVEYIVDCWKLFRRKI